MFYENLKKFVDRSNIYYEMKKYSSLNFGYNKDRYKSLYQTLRDDAEWEELAIGPEGFALEISTNQPFSIEMHKKAKNLARLNWIYHRTADMTKIMTLGRVFGIIKTRTRITNFGSEITYVEKLLQYLTKLMNPSEIKNFNYDDDIISFFRIIEIDEISNWILAERVKDKSKFHFPLEIVKDPMRVILEKKENTKNIKEELKT